MSPELELLDVLLGEDEPLHTALFVFGWPKPRALERAQHAVWMMVREGVINVRYRAATGERVLAEWEARDVFAIKANWLGQHEQAEYFLSLTDKGVQ